MLRLHVKPALGSVKLADLRAEMVDHFLASRSHLAKTYVGRMRSFLIGGMDHALRRDKVRRNEAS